MWGFVRPVLPLLSQLANVAARQAAAGPVMPASAAPVRQPTALVLLTLTALMWAGNATAARLAVGEVSPMLLTAARWTGAVLVLLPFTARRLAEDRAEIRRLWPYLLLLGAVGFAGFNLLLYSAAQTTTAVNITIIQAAIPMLIFVINLAIFSVPIRPLVVLGYLLTLGGVALVAGRGDLASLARLEVSEGDALMLLACLCYAGYTIGLKRRMALHPLSLLTVLCAAAALTSVPMALFESWRGAMIFTASPVGLGVIAYTILMPSVISQWFYMLGVASVGANRAGMFVNLVPVFGAGIALLVLAEALAMHQAVALGMVFGGILIAQSAGGRG